MPIKGKQIADNTITQKQLGVTTESIVSDNDVTTKEYVIDSINSGVSSLNSVNADYNIPANVTTGAQEELATNQQITYQPSGGVRVFVNGLEVNVGSGLTCYFAPENVIPATPRNFGEEQLGDYLWWNSPSASFQLGSGDEIDYVYSTFTPIT